MSAPWWWGIAAVVVAASLGFVGALLARRTGKEANVLDGWASLSAAHITELARVNARIDDLEKRLTDEQHERRQLGDILRSAWTHILRLGDQIRELDGEPLQVPPELTAWMSQDGMVVDRVETTYSRTTITDTRSTENTLEVTETH